MFSFFESKFIVFPTVGSKTLGIWEDVTSCMTEKTDNDGKPCGVGTIEQHRACIDGHFQKCGKPDWSIYPADIKQFVACSVADCPGIQIL